MIIVKTSRTPSSDGDELYIEFENAIGAYNNPDNLGGFGAPNPVRTALGFFLVANYEPTSPAANVPASVAAYDPETVSSFTVQNILTEGPAVLHHYVISIEEYDDQLAYNDGDVTYNVDDVNDKYIQVMINAAWQRITADDVVAGYLEAPYVEYLDEYYLAHPSLVNFKDDLLKIKLSKFRAYNNKECGRQDYLQVRDDYEYVRDTLHSIALDFCAGDYGEAQKQIEELIQFQEKVEA